MSIVRGRHYKIPTTRKKLITCLSKTPNQKSITIKIQRKTHQWIQNEYISHTYTAQTCYVCMSLRLFHIIQLQTFKKEQMNLTCNISYWSETGVHLQRSCSHPKERGNEQVGKCPVHGIISFEHLKENLSHTNIFSIYRLT